MSVLSIKINRKLLIFSFFIEKKKLKSNFVLLLLFLLILLFFVCLVLKKRKVINRHVQRTWSLQPILAVPRAALSLVHHVNALVHRSVRLYLVRAFKRRLVLGARHRQLQSGRHSLLDRLSAHGHSLGHPGGRLFRQCLQHSRL